MRGRDSLARSLRTAVVLTVLAGLLGSGLGTAVADVRPIERRFSRLVNDTRAGLDAGPLRITDRLSDAARRHTRKMVQEGELFHSDLGRLLTASTSSVAENVGYASSLSELLAAFLDSPPHTQNLLGEYTRTGIGIVRVDGRIWLTQVFAA